MDTVFAADFPEIHVVSEGGQWGPKTLRAEGSLNGGGPNLKVSTTTGDIWLRKGQPVVAGIQK